MNASLAKVLFIDNFDSFSFNIVDDIKQLGVDVTVVRNDVSMQQVAQFISQNKISHMVISPGPGTPEDAGICIELIQQYRGKIPLFGICLGFQAMVIACGGEVAEIETPSHGKSSNILWSKSVLMQGLPNPFRAGRYHSLGAKEVTKQLRVTAQTDGIPMAVENEHDCLFAVQFHPESILTPTGNKILANFFNQSLQKTGGIKNDKKITS